jgi:23S rRNA pseudouridine1911/1915/1917 synthase
MQTSLSVINDWVSVEEFLIKGLLITRSAIKKSNLKKTFLSRSLKIKDEISLPINLLNKGLVNPNFILDKIEVLYEDDSLWVLNKPHSLHGHPLTYNESDNVLSFLRSSYNNEFLGERSLNMEKGLLYRLDQVTSGLLIIAKKEQLANDIREDFKTIAKTKAYIAIVHGEFNLEGTHTHFLSSQGSKGHKNIANLNGEGAKASLKAKCLDYNKEKDLSFIYVELETGLRHQIRSQMAALGFPLLGDELYGGKKEQRVYLHAYKYQLKLESQLKEWTCNQAPLFDSFFDIHSCLKMLGQ